LKQPRKLHNKFDQAVTKLEKHIVQAIDDPEQRNMDKKNDDGDPHYSEHASRLQRLMGKAKHKALVEMVFTGNLVGQTCLIY
jgi:hypothetical protein